MFLSYIQIAWRSLQKNRAVSIINIGGLTIGLASAVLAILFAQHEFSYENSHEKADRISRVYTKGNFDQVQWIPTSFGPDGPALKTMFPEVEEYTRSYQFPQSVARVGENLFFEDKIYAADLNFFNILTKYTILNPKQGDWHTQGEWRKAETYLFTVPNRYHANNPSRFYFCPGNFKTCTPLVQLAYGHKYKLNRQCTFANVVVSICCNHYSIWHLPCPALLLLKARYPYETCSQDYPVDLQYHFDVLEGTEEAKTYISAVKLMNLFSC